MWVADPVAYRAAMDRGVSLWVRIGLILIAVPQLITGLWATVAPRNWYDHFPGIGPSLVAAEPPFNAHLTTDAGAGFLTTAVALLAAAVVGRRNGVYIALLSYLVLAIVHFTYHVAHQAPGLSETAHIGNALLLASGIVMASVLAWGARSTGSAQRTARHLAPDSTGSAPLPNVNPR